jgi:hypothetical protein
MKKLIFTFLILFSTSNVIAQIPVNPTTIQFDSPDHAIVTSYIVGYFSSAISTVPVQEATLIKPGTCSPCSGNLPSRPSAFQNWWVGVKAIAGTASSPYSVTVPFVRQLEPPVNVKVN